jgi:signal transduction histidine kinase
MQNRTANKDQALSSASIFACRATRRVSLGNGKSGYFGSDRKNLLIQRLAPRGWVEQLLIGYDGMMYAHGRPAVVGKNMLELKDASGKFFVKDMAIFAREGRKPGWVDYMFQNPATGKIEPKSSYVIPFDDFYVGVGAYKAVK